MQPITVRGGSSLRLLMRTARRIHRGHAMIAAAVAAPIIAIGSLSAAALAQPTPGAGVPAASDFAFGQAAATGLSRARLWA